MKMTLTVSIVNAISVSLFCPIFCQPASVKVLNRKYVALNAETFWEYQFNSNNTYLYTTRGHFGNSITIGKYKINRDTIILKAYPKDKQKDPNFFFGNDTLLIENDTCLIDHLGFEHLLLRTDQDTIFTSRRRNLKLPGRPVVE